jgi:hypothetical protein
LVLAFSQPIILNKKAPQVNPGAYAVSIYIDNSFSMDSTNKKGTLLENSKTLATEIVNTFNASDKFQLLTNDFEGKHQRFISKEEFFELREKIINHMNNMPYVDKQGLIYKYGEFFPIEICPFAYNETTAQEFFPLDKEKALAMGYEWRDTEKRNYTSLVKSPDAKQFKSIPNLNGSLSFGLKRNKWNVLFSSTARNTYTLNYIDRQDYQSSTELAYKYRDTSSSIHHI